VVKLAYIADDGTTSDLEAREGDSVMQTATTSTASSANAAAR
jgi:hypothetical protein